MEEEGALMYFACPKCKTKYTSLDFASLLNAETGIMTCGECRVEVKEINGMLDRGEEGNDIHSRQKRKEVTFYFFNK